MKSVRVEERKGLGMDLHPSSPSGFTARLTERLALCWELPRNWLDQDKPYQGLNNVCWNLGILRGFLAGPGTLHLEKRP